MRRIRSAGRVTRPGYIDYITVDSPTPDVDKTNTDNPPPLHPPQHKDLPRSPTDVTSFYYCDEGPDCCDITDPFCGGAAVMPGDDPETLQRKLDNKDPRTQGPTEGTVNPGAKPRGAKPKQQKPAGRQQTTQQTASKKRQKRQAKKQAKHAANLRPAVENAHICQAPPTVNEDGSTSYRRCGLSWRAASWRTTEMAINGAEPDRVSHNNPKYHEHYYHLREFVRLHKNLLRKAAAKAADTASGTELPATPVAVRQVPRS